ncbi:MAG: DHA2 family efflux MFS transporter permease subunit [Aeromicrobium sp.]
MDTTPSPWPALWAMVIGFFMILVDNSIVSVATPAIGRELHADVNAAIWVTSAYLLAYAVPLLVTGRLGDRFGPKWVYLTGLSIFTASSLWCGLTHSIEGLIVARVVQGLGASLMTPQTMAVITRTFPAAKRGSAMSLWGTTAGVATLVGPILGGVLVDTAGWQWIFFINVPVGVIGFVLAWRLVPVLETHSHTFDWLGVALSAGGMFLLTFGIQEGATYNWGQITGALSVPLLIVLGVAVFALFLEWQNRIVREPLVPLTLFLDRNFCLSNAGIACTSLAITATFLPFTFYAQAARGWSPTEAALLGAPMAVVMMLTSPFVGRLIDTVHPRRITLVGFGTGALTLLWLTHVVQSLHTPVWLLCTAWAVFGLSNACMWAPLAATATRNLPQASAGAGAGVYNAVRQIGAVLGSAAVAALIESRLNAHHLPTSSFGQTGGSMPAHVLQPFADAMGEAMVLPMLTLGAGFVISLFFAVPEHVTSRTSRVIARDTP